MPTKVIEGNLDAKGLRFAVVASRFNHFIVDKLIEGAKDALVRHGANESDITVIRCPGSFEIPAVVKQILEKSKGYDAIICLGAVLKGDTPHFDYIAAEVTKGIANLSISATIPVVMGMVTADTLEQAINRAGVKSGNKGHDAAMSAIEMARLYKQI
ncbi:MAG: 6,7-dimethyl-8-ribityllumazine synthase [Myxococcota bacterium]